MKNSEVEKRLALGFERSLAQILGESGAKAVMRLGNVSSAKLEPQKIDSSLKDIFGRSPDGLSLVQDKVLKRMSSELGVPIDEGPKGYSFESLLEDLASGYKLREKTGLGLAGFAAAIGSSICCLGPLALALLGLASLSASASLAIDLTSKYKPIEVGVSVALMSAVLIVQLIRRGQCSLNGLKRNLGYVLIPAVTLIVTYSTLNYWLGVSFLGGFNLRDLLP